MLFFFSAPNALVNNHFVTEPVLRLFFFLQCASTRSSSTRTSSSTRATRRPRYRSALAAPSMTCERGGRAFEDSFAHLDRFCACGAQARDSCRGAPRAERLGDDPSSTGRERAGAAHALHPGRDPRQPPKWPRHAHSPNQDLCAAARKASATPVAMCCRHVYVSGPPCGRYAATASRAALLSAGIQLHHVPTVCERPMSA